MSFPLHEPPEEATRAALSAYDDLTASLLARRGITTHEEAEAFLSPSYDAHLHDPMLMKNMRRAAERLSHAISTKEKICVWSDYDCDGIPGGVLMHDFLKKAEANFINYIPHRHLEGYGVNITGIEALAKDGVKLIITIDSGITDVEAVARAQELGMDVIVTDHHLPSEILPPAFAVIDAKQEGETYPYKELCGSGVAWKLVCATLAVGFTGRELIPLGWEKWLLDMAGLATIADMVPLTGENRVLATYGLLVMRKSKRLGLQKLCALARVTQRFISEDDVGFMIAPRVNAASRMGDPRDAFTLFTTDDETEADLLAKKLESLNRSRRSIAGATTRAVHERLLERKQAGIPLPDVIVMGDPEWRPGLLGLVANGIAEEYERPVFLWGREGNENLKGSCRAGRKSVNVVELMRAAGDALIDFGGHAASGGFSVTTEGSIHLEERLSQALASLEEQVTETREAADMHLTLDMANHTLLKKLERFAPFGMGNEKPICAFTQITVENISWFGKSSEHLRLHLKGASVEDMFLDKPIEAIAFYAVRELGKVSTEIKRGEDVSALAYLEKDTFTRGQPIRLRLVSIKRS